MQNISAQQLKDMMDKQPDLTLINVLDNEQFHMKNVPGSINVPVAKDHFPEKVEKETGGKDAPVVVYCASMDCKASEKAAKELEEAGFTEVYDFVGGVKAWNAAGYTLVKSGA